MPDTLDQAALDDLLSMVGDDPGFVDELVETYLQDAPSQIGELRAALDAGASDPLVRPAHTLKGASASIGARAVEALARAIEDRARAGAMDEIPGLLTELEAAYEALVESLAEARRRRWAAA